MSNVYMGVVDAETGEAPPVKAKRAWRTAVQASFALIVMMPGLLQTPGVMRAWPWLIGVIPSAAALAALMASKPVQSLLPAWLRL